MAVCRLVLVTPPRSKCGANRLHEGNEERFGKREPGESHPVNVIITYERIAIWPKKGTVPLNAGGQSPFSMGRANWRVVELWELSATELLAMNDVGLVPWIPLTRRAGGVAARVAGKRGLSP